ncbi:hypothetical protein Gotri_005630 [Gossypium trilobum]|uniref:Putative plant transposon protein domain-containing protein n=1 Tax=Gossypium trilobum TaxID=34281 RepID=A0A7J9EY57_9ROSI|nr:hypothetical protein [Gossypium trilobum]
MRECKGMWENASEREWTKFCLPAKEPIVIPLVQEFYLALKQKEVTRPFYEMHAVVKVRGVNISVTKRSICQIYDAPYYYRDYLYRTDLMEFRNINMEEILQFLMDGKEMWTYKIGKRIAEGFDQELMILKAKIWMKFFSSRILSTIEMSKRLPLVSIFVPLQCWYRDTQGQDIEIPRLGLTLGAPWVDGIVIPL